MNIPGTFVLVGISSALLIKWFFAVRERRLRTVLSREEAASQEAKDERQKAAQNLRYQQSELGRLKTKHAGVKRHVKQTKEALEKFEEEEREDEEIRANQMELLKASQKKTRQG